MTKFSCANFNSWEQKNHKNFRLSRIYFGSFLLNDFKILKFNRLEIIITATPINKKKFKRTLARQLLARIHIIQKKVLKAVAVRHYPKNVSYHTILCIISSQVFCFKIYGFLTHCDVIKWNILRAMTWYFAVVC